MSEAVPEEGTGGQHAATSPGRPGARSAAARWLDEVPLASLDALGRPDLWPLALLGFLVRGGLLLFLLPIVELPSPVGIASFVGLHVLTIGGDPTPGLVVAAAALVLGLVGWLLLGGLLAAALEARLVRSTLAAEDSAAEPPGPGLDLAVRLLAVRLVALLPLALALGWWIVRIVDVAYRELTVPLDLATPVAVRALADAADADAAVLVTWLLAEAWGALAVRRILLDSQAIRAALVGALGDLLRRPISSLATLGLAVLGSAILVAPPLVGAWIAWSRLAVAARVGVLSPADLGGALPASLAEVLGPPFFLILLLVAFLGGLALAGAASAGRSALWTRQALGRLAVARPDAPSVPPNDSREGA
ncbi:MAG TPA: hypothetical protein VF763_05160 [Candidatus Limnocylindrales bacterium]